MGVALAIYTAVIASSFKSDLDSPARILNALALTIIIFLARSPSLSCASVLGALSSTLILTYRAIAYSSLLYTRSSLIFSITTM